MGKAKKKKQLILASNEVIQLGQKSISADFTFHDYDSDTGSFDETLASFSHNLGSRDTLNDVSKELGGPSHAPGHDSKALDLNASKVFDTMPEPAFQDFASVVSTVGDKDKATYATIAKDNRNLSEGLMLHQVQNTNHDQKRCVIRKEKILDVEKVLGFCLVGYFACSRQGCHSPNVFGLESSLQIPSS